MIRKGDTSVVIHSDSGRSANFARRSGPFSRSRQAFSRSTSSAKLDIASPDCRRDGTSLR